MITTYQNVYYEYFMTTTYQNVYYFADSFVDAKNKLRSRR